MQLNIKGIAITVDEAAVAALIRDKLLEETPSFPDLHVVDVPRIGEPYAGGIYVGIGRAVDGSQHHLIVGPAADKSLNWKDALAWAEQLTEGNCEDWQLPTRRDQSLCFANVPELFEKECYWSCEQYAGNGAFAWYQLFGYGYQDYGRKGDELRARAVRRLAI